MSLEGAPRPSLYQAMEHPPDKRVPPGCGSRKAGPSSAPYEPVASAALREAFARAIAYREDLLAGLINADNTLNDWVSIAKAIQAEQAFFVEVDVDVLAIDGDDPALADNLYDIGSELTTAGERPVVLESGQSGRLHLFCRVRDGILHERLRQRARQLGLDVRYQIRPPLSPHRLGLVPRLMLPADPQEALSALQPSNLRRRRDLSPRMRELLETGVNPRGSRSQGIISLAVSAVNARWTFSEFRTAMDRSPAGAKLHDRPDADKELRRVWAKAIRFVRLSPPIATENEASHLIRAVRALADDSTWPGRAGATDRAVLEAHLCIAERAHFIEYTASVRQIAEAAGLSTRTVSASHSRLCANWLERIAVGSKGLASKWKLAPRNVSHVSTLPTSCGGREGNLKAGDTDTSFGHDVWRWRGLGPAARHLFTLLPVEGSISIEALVRRRGTARSAVHKLLRKLKRQELVVQLGGGTWRRNHVDQETLDRIARCLGTAGAGRQQRWFHEDERERYRRRQRRGTLKLQPAVDAQGAPDRPPDVAKREDTRKSSRPIQIAQAACARPVKGLNPKSSREGGKE